MSTLDNVESTISDFLQQQVAALTKESTAAIAEVQAVTTQATQKMVTLSTDTLSQVIVILSNLHIKPAILDELNNLVSK
jgi:hypothetical protein